MLLTSALANYSNFISFFFEMMPTIILRTKICTKTKYIHRNNFIFIQIYKFIANYGYSKKVFEINHKNANYSLIMTADTLNKDLFQSNNELKFLKLTYSLEKWCNKLRDKLMTDYGWKKNYG